jgi:regulator of nucleoside diphosphate kinase
MKKIILSKIDYQRLKDFIQKKGPVYIRHELESLDEVLKTAELVNPGIMPSYVVTMNSRIRIKDLELDDEYICTLNYPGQTYLSEENCSILTPMGTALLGSRVGDIIRCDMTHNSITMRVEEILYQPEAACDYHL